MAKPRIPVAQALALKTRSRTWRMVAEALNRDHGHTWQGTSVAEAVRRARKNNSPAPLDRLDAV